MTPFAIRSPDQFLPRTTPPLTSRRYAQDFAEVKSLGQDTSTTRRAFDSETAVFWQSDVPVAIWDRVADDLAAARRMRVTETARLLAADNIAMADAVIAIWNAKNHFDTWRPVTAIRSADTDGNPATTADPTWTPLLVTPAFQEYPAGHPGVSAAAAEVLARTFGDQTQFTVTSANLAGVSRSFSSLDSAKAQVIDARVFAGIHFRTAGQVAVAMGDQIAHFVLATQLRPRTCGA